ncbi:hypothetical protein F4780DRAFT_443047 [Xylariomycetidae sp. FL0641]|nr:hypothetical protein F4780DRAFT_443047 [Xylariomycetidae sp. FL0641]
MATSTVATGARKACFLLGLLALLPGTSADDATTNPMLSVPEALSDSAMMLSLEFAGVGPLPAKEYSVGPLTGKARLDSKSVAGNVVGVDATNYNNVDLANSVAMMSCDPNADSLIQPSQMINQVMTSQDNQPKAILLYSTDEECCSLGGSNLPFEYVWTMLAKEKAWEMTNFTSHEESTGMVYATIASNGTTSNNQEAGQQGGSNSAVAMSILYSITGLITFLFIIIIATGAFRAHRNPERYGPRPSIGGRPRQSRAKGIARAMLETLPIVKFGDPAAAPVKSDEESELGRMSGERTTDLKPHVETAHNVAVHPAGSAVPVTVVTPPEADTSATGESRNEASAGNEEHLGCSICTEDFQVGEDVRVLPCDHKFHPACVDPWLVNVSGTCPLCRLDLRPMSARFEAAEEGEASEPHSTAPAQEPPVSPSLPVPSTSDGTTTAGQRPRRSWLMDWNRLRHAPVDERIQALRHYRQSQQGIASVSGEDHSQHLHHKLTERLREKFHIRTRPQSPVPEQ